MSDLPYAKPSGQTTLTQVQAASRRADKRARRDAHGLMPYATLRLWLGERDTGYRSRRNIFSDYPIVALDALTIDGRSVDLTDAVIGERRVQVDGIDWGEEVYGTGLFGWARRVQRGAVATGQTFAPAATSFDAAAFGSAVDAPEGSVWLIGGEQMYADASGLVRGANGTEASAHAAGSALYELVLDEDISEDVQTLARRAREQGRVAADRRGEGDAPFDAGLAPPLYLGIAQTFDRLRPKLPR